MLLIDNNDAERGKRREQRGAGTDNNGGLPALCPQPDSQPFAVIHAGMENIHRCLKTGAETGDGLGGQADFRHQYQGLAAFSQHIFQHTEIHLGFPSR